MPKESIFKDYTGADATGEILIMLLVAFLLGFLLRWLQNKFWGCQHCSESELEHELKKVQNMGVSETKKTMKQPVMEKASVAAVLPRGVKQDDLKIVEGIGPKIEELLKNNGVKTWEQLANSKKERLVNILRNAGDRFKLHDPSTWSEQAMLAHKGSWDELEEYQDFLNGGKER